MYYCYNEIETIRREQLHKQLSRADLQHRKEMDFKRSSLLFRLVNHFRPTTLLEIGTSWGISTLYMYAGYPGAKQICIESDPKIVRITKEILAASESSIQLYCSDELESITDILQPYPTIDFIFIHRNDRPDYYRTLFERLSDKITDRTVWVIEDIHASKAIESQWKQLASHKEAKVTMDLYDFGLIFCNQKLNKQDYIVAF